MDTNEKAETVYMEVLYLRHLSVPESLIAWYVGLKFNMEWRDCLLAAMRHTGEPGTYRFNTNFTKAIFHIRYMIKKKHPRAFSGDDAWLKRRGLTEWPYWDLWHQWAFPDLELRSSFLPFRTLSDFSYRLMGSVVTQQIFWLS